MTQEQYPKSHHENDGLSKYGGRDLMGYAAKPPTPKWPRGAKVALNFVINYEEGSESCLLHGDNESEKLLSEIVGGGAYGTCRMYAECVSEVISFFRFVDTNSHAIAAVPRTLRRRKERQHGKSL
jgi:hypothetical protein